MLYEHIVADDRFTKCISIGPVSAPILGAGGTFGGSEVLSDALGARLCGVRMRQAYFLDSGSMYLKYHLIFIS